MVEIPFQPSVASELHQVWRELSAARQVLERGDWRSCAVAARKALELWRAVDALDCGTDGSGKKRLRKHQRLDCLRRDLHQFLSYPLHVQNDENADPEWSRADATLAVGMICALLTARLPLRRECNAGQPSDLNQ